MDEREPEADTAPKWKNLSSILRTRQSSPTLPPTAPDDDRRATEAATSPDERSSKMRFHASHARSAKPPPPPAPGRSNSTRRPQLPFRTPRDHKLAVKPQRARAEQHIHRVRVAAPDPPPGHSRFAVEAEVVDALAHSQSLRISTDHALRRDDAARPSRAAAAQADDQLRASAREPAPNTRPSARSSSSELRPEAAQPRAAANRLEQATTAIVLASTPQTKSPSPTRAESLRAFAAAVDYSPPPSPLRPHTDEPRQPPPPLPPAHHAVAFDLGPASAPPLHARPPRTRVKELLRRSSKRHSAPHAAATPTAAAVATAQNRTAPRSVRPLRKSSSTHAALQSQLPRGTRGAQLPRSSTQGTLLSAGGATPPPPLPPPPSASSLAYHSRRWSADLRQLAPATDEHRGLLPALDAVLQFVARCSDVICGAVRHVPALLARVPQMAWGFLQAVFSPLAMRPLSSSEEVERVSFEDRESSGERPVSEERMRAHRDRVADRGTSPPLSPHRTSPMR